MGRDGFSTPASRPKGPLLRHDTSRQVAESPVVLLNGTRQTRKSKLAQEIVKARSMCYVTPDDATQLAAARSDAQGFLAGLGGG